MDFIIDEKELCELLFENAKNEDPDALSMLADLHFWKGDYTSALVWYKMTDLKNHADGQYMLGVIYHHGYGVEQDYQLALGYFLKAYGNGKDTAGTDIGRAYYFGFGVEQDYEKAMEYYMTAADSGDFNAEYYIGLLYEQGDGVEMDIQLALEWYDKSAENGSKVALICKKRLYDEGYRLDKKQNDVESLKAKLNDAKKKLVASENENDHLKKETKRLKKDIMTIRAMYDAYKEKEAKMIQKNEDLSKLRKGCAGLIMRYFVEDDDDDDDE